MPFGGWMQGRTSGDFSWGVQVPLSGRTTSPDLPLHNADQTELQGGSDGFTALISTKLIGASVALGSRHLVAICGECRQLASPALV
jgi:hypothetical protein